MSRGLTRRREKHVRRQLEAHLRAAVDPKNDRPRRHRAARAAACEAEQLGLLARPPACECCGDSAERLQRHHWDHAQPLRVSYLCPDCHKTADALIANNGESSNGHRA